MNNKQLKQDIANENTRSTFLNTRNPLGIGKKNFIWDRNKHHLILIIESNQAFFKETKAMVADNRLILEAPLLRAVEKPIRTHLIGRVIRDDIENGLLDIRFAEMKLKSGYLYSLISCQVINDSLLKVILHYKPSGRNMDN